MKKPPRPPAAQSAPPTAVKPVGSPVKEPPGNLAAREAHFAKRRGGTPDKPDQAKRKRQMLRP